MNRILASLAIPAFLLAACAGPQPLACRPPLESGVVVDLLFGRNIGGRPGVSEAQWRTFLARDVTPRFPEGLTVIDAAGQWRDPARGTIVRERSKVVTIALRDGGVDQARIEAIVDAYKSRFHQQSVGVTIRPACVSFQ